MRRVARRWSVNPITEVMFPGIGLEPRAGSRPPRHELVTSLPLQMCIYFNLLFLPCWAAVLGVVFHAKLDRVDLLNRYIYVTVAAGALLMELVRLYVGYLGNLREEVPELAGFWLVTLLLACPLHGLLLLNSAGLRLAPELAVAGPQALLVAAQLALGYAAVRRLARHQPGIQPADIADSEEDNYDYIFKVVLVGNSGVGKSNLFTRFTRNTFRMQTLPTIGLDLDAKNKVIDSKTVRSQAWDSRAGALQGPRLHALPRRAGRPAVYDVTELDTFRDLERLSLQELRLHADDKIAVILVGDKADLRHLRTVYVEWGCYFAEKHGLSFVEKSALDSTNLDAAFENIFTELYRRVSRRSI